VSSPGARSVGLVGLAVGLTVAVATGTWWLRAHRHQCGDLGPMSGYPENSVAYVKCVPAFVVRGIDDDFAVYVAKVPHMPNEPLEWDNARRLFVSPFHGETFTLQGQPVSGPARRALWRCPIEIDPRNHLVIRAPTPEPENLGSFCQGKDASPGS
jgi:Rieske Fe-S protein